MDDARNTKKIYEANLHLKRPKGRPQGRWKDDVEMIRVMGIVNLRKGAQDRDGGSRANREGLKLL
jgi:hypothetical protein